MTSLSDSPPNVNTLQPSEGGEQPSDLARLWRHIFGTQRGCIGLFAGDRVPGTKELRNVLSAYFKYPSEIDKAEQWLTSEVAENDQRDVYFCAHLLRKRRRKKEHAAKLHAAYVDAEEVKVPAHLPKPTAIVESSPGRFHYYWRLSHAVDPAIGEEINRRLAYAIAGADTSGWDLTQLLRPPGFPNRKYAGHPIVKLIEITDDV